MAQSSVTTSPDPAPAAAAGPDPRFLDPALDRTSIRPDAPIDARGTAGDVSRDASGAHVRAEALRALSAGQDRRRRLPRHGPGGDRHRRREPARSRDDYFSTVARGLAGWFMRGIEPKHVHGALVRQGHPAEPRPRAGIVPRRSEAVRHGAVPQRLDGVVDSVGRRVRARVQVSRRAARVCGADRRRRHQPRRLLRRAQLRRDPQAAARGHRREQLLRLLDAAVAADAGGQRGRSRAGVQHSRGDRIRQRHLRSAPAGAAGVRSRAQRPGPVSGRVQDLPSARPRRARRHGVRARRSAGVLGAPRSGPAAAGVSARRGRHGRRRCRSRSTTSAGASIEDAVA